MGPFCTGAIKILRENVYIKRIKEFTEMDTKQSDLKI